MAMQDQDAIDRCDFLDVLEEAAHFHRPVQIELRDGQRFTAEVRDVVTDAGEDFVVLADRGRVPVSRIVRCASTLSHETGYDAKT